MFLRKIEYKKDLIDKIKYCFWEKSINKIDFVEIRIIRKERIKD